MVYSKFSKPINISKSKKSVADLIKALNKDKRLMLKVTGGNSKEWKEALKLYLTSYKDKNENPFSLTKQRPIEIPDGSENASDEFMNACYSLSLEMVVDEKDNRYENVLKYCTRATLVSDLIRETSGKILLVKVDNFANDKDWKSVWELYKEDNNIGDRDSWDLGKGNWDSKKGGVEVPVEFVDGCLEKSKVKEHLFTQPTYLDVLKYCTKTG